MIEPKLSLWETRKNVLGAACLGGLLGLVSGLALSHRLCVDSLPEGVFTGEADLFTGLGGAFMYLLASYVGGLLGSVLLGLIGVLLGVQLSAWTCRVGTRRADESVAGAFRRASRQVSSTRAALGASSGAVLGMFVGVLVSLVVLKVTFPMLVRGELPAWLQSMAADAGFGLVVPVWMGAALLAVPVGIAIGAALGVGVGSEGPNGQSRFSRETPRERFPNSPTR